MAEKIQALLGDEESMKQIKELAEMFGGGMGQNHTPPPFNPSQGTTCDSKASNNHVTNNDNDLSGLLGNINPLAIMQLIEAFSHEDSNCELIMALRPHLSKDKQQKADRAVKMLKLYNVYIAMKESGMLNDLNL